MGRTSRHGLQVSSQLVSDIPRAWTKPRANIRNATKLARMESTDESPLGSAAALLLRGKLLCRGVMEVGPIIDEREQLATGGVGAFERFLPSELAWHHLNRTEDSHHERFVDAFA